MRFEEIRQQMFNQRNGPLVFLHIPKTAGMSLIQALKDLQPWAHMLTGPPFLSQELMARAGALPPSEMRETLIYGHPVAGILSALENATLVTVVREPAAHAVSHYLFTRRRPEIPLHGESLRLDFSAFVRKNWQYLVYQNISLGVCDALKCDATPKDFLHHAPRIQEIFRRIDVVGTTDDLSGFIVRVAGMLGVHAPKIERLNQAVEEGVSADEIAVLHTTYRDLAHDPELARLIACEQELYDIARHRAAFGR